MCQKSQLAKLGLFDAKVPRYTSYPPAPYFGAQITSEHFTAWIDKIPPGSCISLYLHVPFCRNLCWFCACRTQGARSDTPIADYILALKQEISLLKQQLPDGISLSRLHWGGGTPTILSPNMIRDLSEAIFELAPLAPDGQFLVEIDPNEFDDPRSAAFSAAGLTHASIGVQDFEATIQQIIGRPLDFETVQQTVEMLRRHGLKNLNTDILFGLPHQTINTITQSTNALLGLGPDRISVHGYSHLPSQIRRQIMIPSETLPTPEDRLKLFDAAKSVILQEGYQEIGIDHFARPLDGLTIAREAQNLRRGFQGYHDDPAEVLIGLGASAISRFPQGYVQNAPGTARYVSDIRGGRFASARGHQFRAEDALRHKMIEALLCNFYISRTALHDQFPDMQARIDTLLASANHAFHDLLELDQEGLFIPPAARPLARVIARSFDVYADAAQTSKSISAA